MPLIMLSFWEQDTFVKYDIIIIGAGISGLSTAASLKEKHPKLNILVLERGLLPTGASTKNAGFACFGSLTEILSDLETMSEKELLALVDMRWKGLIKTRSRLGDERIDYQNHGGYELFSEDDQSLNKLSEINRLLSAQFDNPVYRLANENISTFGFGKTKHLVFNSYEGQLHTGKLIDALWSYCMRIGIKIITGAEVLAIEESAQFVTIQAKKMQWQARKIAICTNAFTNKLLNHKYQINPGRGLVLAVKPKTDIKFKGTFHYNEGYFYFRNFKDKIIFGGGRNIDKKTENTTSFEINEEIKSKLIEDLESVIIPNVTYDITNTWTGIMAFGDKKAPIIEKFTERIFVGARLGGMGVAIGSQVGEALASKMIHSGF